MFVSLCKISLRTIWCFLMKSVDKRLTLNVLLQNNDKTKMILDDNVLKGMIGFFDLYDKQAQRLDESLHELQNQEERLLNEMTALTNNLQEISSTKEQREAR